MYTIKPDFSKFNGDFGDFSGDFGDLSGDFGDSGDFSKSSDPLHLGYSISGTHKNIRPDYVKIRHQLRGNEDFSCVLAQL